MSDHEETAKTHKACRVPKVPETQTMDKLYLEWSLFTTARNGRECRMHRAVIGATLAADKLPEGEIKAEVQKYLSRAMSEYSQGIDL